VSSHAERARLRDPDATARGIGALATASLWTELALYPKPGLVSLRDSGAHTDMSAATFVRSIVALRPGFVAIAAAGARGASFGALRELGIDCERRMMRATGGVNTHRGAIFTLGLIAAAAGAIATTGLRPTDAVLRAGVLAWGRELTAFSLDVASPPSHGRLAATRYGAAGARGEATHAFPAVFEVGLPALREALARRASASQAQLHALFALLAHVEDTNVLHRGGPAALAFVQRAASAFLAANSVFAPGWRSRAVALHRGFCMRRISPGGSADLLAACWFVNQLQR
jgi:triphosphoribosyl-dephospho-CoA synthase